MKYVFPKRFESRNLEEALMAGGPFRLILFLDVKFCLYFIFLDRSFVELGVLGFVFIILGLC